MDTDFAPLIHAAFPGQAARHFAPMVMGGGAEGDAAGTEIIVAWFRVARRL